VNRSIASPPAATWNTTPGRLTLEKSKYPAFSPGRVQHRIRKATSARGFPGPRPGPARVPGHRLLAQPAPSLALVNDKTSLLVDVYRKTGGDPIGATQKLCRALRELEEKKGARIEVLGAGTTGRAARSWARSSARHAIINEISAHVAGATFTDSQRRHHLREIGRQDAKYMHIVDGPHPRRPT